MTIRSMQSELRQWGAWARSTERTGGIRPYVCPTYTMMLQAVGQKGRQGVQIVLDDDALLAVDQLVQALRRSRPELYQWINSHYLKAYSVSALAQVTGISRRDIDKHLYAAESWPDSRLETLCEMADNAH